MNDEIKINKSNKSITFINDGIAFSQFGIADEILNLIANLQQDNTMYAQLKDEYEEEIKDLQQKNDKAIEYIEENSSDYWDNGKLLYREINADNVIDILKGDSNE